MRPATTPGTRRRKTIVPIHARAGEDAGAMRVRLARFLPPREGASVSGMHEQEQRDQPAPSATRPGS